MLNLVTMNGEVRSYRGKSIHVAKVLAIAEIPRHHIKLDMPLG
jgi:hypothetical protein